MLRRSRSCELAWGRKWYSEAWCIFIFIFIYFPEAFLFKKFSQSVFHFGFYHIYPEAYSLTFLFSGIRYLKLFDLYPSRLIDYLLSYCSPECSLASREQP